MHEPMAMTTEVRRALHDMSQPLTALQCRLYLGSMETDATALRHAIDDGLVECDRMVAQVRELGDWLNRQPGGDS